MFGGTIRSSFVAAIVVLSLSVAGGVAWSVYSYLERDATAQIQNRARTVGRMLAFNVRAGIEFDDSDAVWSALDATKDNPEISLVRVIDRRGETIATYSASQGKQALRGSAPSIDESSLIMEELPVEGLVTPGQIGKVVVGASDQMLREFRQRMVGVLAGATLLLAVLSSAVTVFFAGQFMSRKRAELTLGGLAKALPGQAFVLSREGVFLTTFGSAEESVLHAAGKFFDPVGKRLTDLFSVTEAMPVLDAISRVTESREPDRFDFRISRGEDYRWFEGRVSPLFSDDNLSVDRVILLTYDITEQRRLSEQLAQVQRLDAMGQLVGGIAHDFNNILNVIVSHGELLRMELSADDPRLTDVNGILSATQRASQVTHRLLAFARKEVVQVQDMDLGEVVKRMHPLLLRAVGERITLKMSVGENLYSVKAAVSQMEQALLNLVVNARDAIRDEGTIIIEVFNVQRSFPAVRDGADTRPMVMLAVSDTGGGIPPEIRDRIFEPFFTTKGVGRGTGLGLSSVLGIAKQNGGQVEVYSEPGKGSTFKLYFPASRDMAEPLKPLADRPVKLPTGGETVLLVEDDLQLRVVNARLLAGLGYTVLEADDGADALHLTERFGGPIDIVVTDVVMPKVTGPELVAKLKSMRPQTHVLYISGYTDNVVLYHGVRHEGVHFLHKPFTAETLAVKLRAILDEPKLSLVKR